VLEGCHFSVSLPRLGLEIDSVLNKVLQVFQLAIMNSDQFEQCLNEAVN